MAQESCLGDRRPAPRIAVLVPCFNEETSIVSVIDDFRTALPQAVIYVYDNNSQDRTVERARGCGAIVRRERLQGKGHVVRRMFADIEADLYVLIDGDATYDAASAPVLIEALLADGLDMVTATRVGEANAAFRRGHRLGNRLLTGLVSWVFGRQVSDMLSGYRILSRRYVKSFPAMSRGFETETELTIHALELRMPVGEVETPYRARGEGSHSKLSTYRDGLRILRMVLLLLKEERPLRFFSAVAVAFAILSLGLGLPVILEFLDTGLVPRFPTAILAASIGLMAFLALTSGVILDSVVLGRREVRRFEYLHVPGPLALPSERIEPPVETDARPLDPGEAA